MVGVWDAEHVRRIGILDDDAGGLVLAATGHGLKHRAVVLDEARSSPECRRVELTILVFSDRFVRLNVARAARYARPVRPERRRIVLVLDERSVLRWWDSELTAGPASIDELPISSVLRDELVVFQRKTRKLRKKRDHNTSSYGRDELGKAQARLDQRALDLWLRARVELARDHVVGFLGRNISSPAWTPDAQDCRDDDMEESFGY